MKVYTIENTRSKIDKSVCSFAIDGNMVAVINTAVSLNKIFALIPLNKKRTPLENIEHVKNFEFFDPVKHIEDLNDFIIKVESVGNQVEDTLTQVKLVSDTKELPAISVNKNYGLIIDIHKMQDKLEKFKKLPGYIRLDEFYMEILK